MSDPKQRSYLQWSLRLSQWPYRLWTLSSWPRSHKQNVTAKIHLEAMWLQDLELLPAIFLNKYLSPSNIFLKFLFPNNQSSVLFPYCRKSGSKVVNSCSKHIRGASSIFILTGFLLSHLCCKSFISLYLLASMPSVFNTKFLEIRDQFPYTNEILITYFLWVMVAILGVDLTLSRFRMKKPHTEF